MLAGTVDFRKLLESAAMRFRWKFLPGLVLVFLLGGCSRKDVPVRAGLNIGQKAPEIVGQDLDGKTMRLSDYRGMVVVLDFWGKW